MVSKRDRIWALYPEYFDSALPRRRGRRVNKELSVSTPTLAELYLSAVGQNFYAVKEENVAFPAYWWRKRGRLLVRKETSKSETIERIAKGLPGARKELERLKMEEEQKEKKPSGSKKDRRVRDRRAAAGKKAVGKKGKKKDRKEVHTGKRRR